MKFIYEPVCSLWKVMLRWPSPLALAFFICGIHVFVSAGCSKSAATASLEGVVKFRGTPVEKGAIRLMSQNASSEIGGITQIQGGRYQLAGSSDLKAGTYYVAIYGFKETGRLVKVEENSPEIKEERQYIPREYNDASTRCVELVPGKNSIDFELK